MGIEAIISVVLAVIVAIAGAFGIGHARGKSNAEAKADEQRTKDFVEGLKKATETRVEVTKNAAQVQETVSRLPDDDIDKQLHDKWRNPSSGD